MKFTVFIKKRHVLKIQRFRPDHTITQIFGEALELGLDQMDDEARKIGFRVRKEPAE